MNVPRLNGLRPVGTGRPWPVLGGLLAAAWAAAAAADSLTIGNVQVTARDGIGRVEAGRVTVVSEPLAPAATLMAFGLEMVYVPEGPFQLGVSAGPELNRFYTWGASDTPPFTVTGPGPIPTGRQPGRLWATGLLPEDGAEIPASFPSGYRAFYAMKFAITQGQYADFLTVLPEAEAARRYHPDGHGKWIGRTGEPPNRVYTALGGFPNDWFRPGFPPRDHRCPWLSWADSAAFAAWAGLRPMTELEYEKACRGPAHPQLTDPGISFWGLEDCNAGQMYERPIAATTATGRAFKGTHGRGTTQLPGDWPADVRGAILRGDVLHMRAYTSAGHQRISGRLMPLDSQAEVTDDGHFNTRSGSAIGNGDALQIGLDTAEGHRSFGAALTTDGAGCADWIQPAPGMPRGEAGGSGKRYLRFASRP